MSISGYTFLSGSYQQISDPVNDSPAWINNANDEAIWYWSGNWMIGPKDAIGTSLR